MLRWPSPPTLAPGYQIVCSKYIDPDCFITPVSHLFSVVEADLARRVHTHRKPHKQFRGRVVWAGGGPGGDGHIAKVCVTNRSDCNVQSSNVIGKSEEMYNNSCVDLKQVPDLSDGVNGVPMCHILYKTVPRVRANSALNLGLNVTIKMICTVITRVWTRVLPTMVIWV